MRVVFIGGNHPRHLYFINAVSRVFPLTAAVIEKRESMLPTPPEGISAHDGELFIRHFAERSQAEERYFGSQPEPDCPLLHCTAATLNSRKTLDFLDTHRPDCVLVFGCGLIREPLLGALPQLSLNLHLGLSPRYRGAATLFWPFYFMEPACAGSTLHYLQARPDTGDIVHQSLPELADDDGIHDVACKVILAAAKDAVRVLDVAKREGALGGVRQKSGGKLFLEADFRPEHLRVIYDLFDNDMVRQYKRGRLPGKVPNLVRLFP